MKAVKVTAICIVLLFMFSLTSAAKEDDAYTDLLSSSGAEELYNSVDSEVKKALAELGIDGVDFSSLFDVSLSKVFNLIKNAVTGNLESPMKSLAKLLSVIILLSIAESFIPDDGRYKPIIGMLGTLFCVSSVIVPLYQAIESAVSSVGMCGIFMKSLIPVLTGVVSASGNPALSISFQSVAFLVAQVMSVISEKYIVPLVGAVIAVDITGALMPSFKLSGITDLIKKTVISAMSFAASLYVSFLGIKGALANSADTVANKGIKLLISSAIPVVGSAVSEAYSGIIGSLVLVRSTVGIFGIVVILIITVPAMMQLLFWIFALKIGTAAGEVFSQDTTVRLLKALASAITLLNVVVLFNGVLFIISMALILTLRQ